MHRPAESDVRPRRTHPGVHDAGVECVKTRRPFVRTRQPKTDDHPGAPPTEMSSDHRRRCLSDESICRVTQRGGLRREGRLAGTLTNWAAGLRSLTAETDDVDGRSRGVRLQVEVEHALRVPGVGAVQATTRQPSLFGRARPRPACARHCGLGAGASPTARAAVPHLIPPLFLPRLPCLCPGPSVRT